MNLYLIESNIQELKLTDLTQARKSNMRRIQVSKHTNDEAVQESEGFLGDTSKHTLVR